MSHTFNMAQLTPLEMMRWKCNIPSWCNFNSLLWSWQLPQVWFSQGNAAVERWPRGSPAVHALQHSSTAPGCCAIWPSFWPSIVSASLVTHRLLHTHRLCSSSIAFAVHRMYGEGTGTGSAVFLIRPVSTEDRDGKEKSKLFFVAGWKHERKVVQPRRCTSNIRPSECAIHHETGEEVKGR